MSSPNILPPAGREQQRTGIPCPQCQAFIEFKIDDLLRKSIFRCRKCGLELTLNRFQSRDSLDALKQMQGALEQFEAVKRQYSEKKDDESK